ncbi:MAG TPA: YoaK family protein [Acidobacteriaceae bacterium]
MSTAAAKLRIRAIPLICLLCATAGSIDAIAYLLWGQVFVANMTGNTVLLAISLLTHQFGKAALRGGLVAAFVAGVVISRLLARHAGERVTKSQRVAVLALQSLVLLLLSWKGAAADARLLLVLLAVILGVQNGAFRYIGGFHLNTTFITGDLELLGEAIVDPRNPMPKVSAFLLSWVGYAGGGLLGALGAQEWPRHTFLFSMTLAMLSALALLLTPDNRSGAAHS